MSNPFNIKKTSKLITNQSERAISRITKDLGDKQYRYELLEKLIQGLQSFFNRLGKPRMTIRKAAGLPQSEPFNATMNEIEDDIHVLYAESETIQKALYADFNYSQVERSKIKNQLNSVIDTIQDFELYASSEGVLSQSGTDIIYGHDSFKNKSRIDETAVAGVLADIDTEDGVATLKLDGKTDQLHGSKIIPVVGQPFTKDFGPIADDLIGSKSNGLPGNTHEVVPKEFGSAGAGEEDLYRFVGEHDAHVDVLAITDGNPDTWYEYEAVNLPQSVKDEVDGYGFAFQVGEEKLNWAFDPMPDGVLRLTLRFTMPEPRIVNWITFEPMTPPNKGAMPAIIDSIYISPDASQPSIKLTTSVKEDANGLQVFTFDSTLVQTIDVSFKQGTSFEALLGYYVYIRTTVTEERKKRFLRKDKVRTLTNVQFVDGPGIPLGVTGTVINQDIHVLNDVGSVLMNVGSVGYAAATVASTTLGIAAASSVLPIALAVVAAGALLSSLFGSTETTVISDEIERHLFADNGTRWCIGIKNLSVLSKTYHQVSELVSKPWRSGTPIKRISLESSELIPEIFSESQENKEWTRYYISIDGGTTWNQINPSNKLPSDIPQVYVVNSTQLPEDRNEKIGYLTSETDVHSVLVRIQLERPTDIEQAETYTPVILDYSLKLQVEVSPE